MIICMCDIICVTNRLLCHENFESRIEKIAQAGPSAIILREKDLSPYEYKILTQRVIKICQIYNVPCILHYFWNIAAELGCRSVHLPLSQLRALSYSQREMFSTIGCSCHSEADAFEAEKIGCRYIFAGHIFRTDCKKDIMPRGTGFLQSVCSSVKIPVYAIGGIDDSNIGQIYSTGARGVCLMSSLMTCIDPVEYIQELRQLWK